MNGKQPSKGHKTGTREGVAGALPVTRPTSQALFPAGVLGVAAMANESHAAAAAEGHKLVCRQGGQTITLQAWGRDSLRVRVTPEGGGQTSDWALDIPLEKEG